MSERETVTLERAIQMLPDGDDVHTFRQAGCAILGADWGREDIIEEMRDAEVIELSGRMATSLGHGLAILDDTGWLFIATKPEVTA